MSHRMALVGEVPKGGVGVMENYCTIAFPFEVGKGWGLHGEAGLGGRGSRVDERAKEMPLV